MEFYDGDGKGNTYDENMEDDFLAASLVEPIEVQIANELGTAAKIDPSDIARVLMAEISAARFALTGERDPALKMSREQHITTCQCLLGLCLAMINQPSQGSRGPKQQKPIPTGIVMPSCPKCSGQMIVRNRHSDGNRFFGCCGFPACRGTVPYRE